MNLDLWILLAAFTLLAVYTWGDSKRIDAQHWRRAYTEERRENAAHRRTIAALRTRLADTTTQLTVAESINAMPCQCGCDDERIGWRSETPVFDRVAVEELLADLGKIERGEA